jgi:hypothetical protein
MSMMHMAKVGISQRAHSVCIKVIPMHIKGSPRAAAVRVWRESFFNSD